MSHQTFLIGAFIIGALSSMFGYPIYNFDTKKFSLANLALIVVLMGSWTIIFLHTHESR